MTTVTVRADEVQESDVFPDGDLVVDKEFFDYTRRRVVEFTVIDRYGEIQAKEFTCSDMVTVDRL